MPITWKQPDAPGQGEEKELGWLARIGLATFTLVGGTVFFSVAFHLSFGIALTLASLASLTYLLADHGWQRAAKLACIAAFAGLGSWLAVGLGSWSLLWAIAAPASYVVYEALEARRHP